MTPPRKWRADNPGNVAIRGEVAAAMLPLVPGDSCHYLEVATSVLRGEGPVKHYVESFFTDYPRIRQGEGVLDDWATPLDAYLRAFTFRVGDLAESVELTGDVAFPDRNALPPVSTVVS